MKKVKKNRMRKTVISQRLAGLVAEIEKELAHLDRERAGLLAKIKSTDEQRKDYVKVLARFVKRNAPAEVETSAPVRSVVKRRKRAGRKLSAKGAIAKVLAADGKAMSKKDIKARVAELGKWSDAGINAGFVNAMKEKSIINPSRGMYQIKK